MIRVFVAFELPETIRTAIADHVQPLRKLPGRVSWVKPENVHLTLKFLGEVPEKKIAEISAALCEIVTTTSLISAEISGMGVFPNARKPRVVWIGLDERSGKLEKLAVTIDGRMHALGFEKEQRPFSPHLTIGRVREGEIGHIIEAMQKRPFAGQTAQFQEITLMRSELHHGGSIYTPLDKFKLLSS